MIVPDFYGLFQCKAKACQHSCCRGWEIDIDKETVDRYQRMQGVIGQMLQNHMMQENGIWHFRMTPKGDCPFLRTDGLCKLIRMAGDGILCTICREHPRFYKQVQGQELAGVGLACEKSVEFLLAEEGPLLFCQIDSEQVGGLKQDRFPFTELLDKLGIEHTSEICHWQACLDTDYIAFVLETLAMTEPIDEEWAKELDVLEQDISDTPVQVRKLLADVPAGYMQRIYQYIFYRQLDALPDYGIDTLVAYTAFNTTAVCLLSIHRTLQDAVRRWSEQIEYSTGNVDLIMDIA